MTLISAANGNGQLSGDAQPYFRIFNLISRVRSSTRRGILNRHQFQSVHTKRYRYL
jgi:hypothetical protein